MSVLKLFRARTFLATLSVLVVLAGVLVGARVAVADSVWFQSYQRASQTEACAAQVGETPWQASWGADSSWKPSWEQWANNGKGGWTCGRSIAWAKDSSCAAGGPYALGDIGPGCGLVFLISGGLTYEMAPNTWSGSSSDDTPKFGWCSDQVNSVATGTAVGTGSANTTAMLTNATPFVACTSSAPNAVRAYAGGGLTDWFLPSQDELNAMGNYSQVTGFNTATYGFGDEVYWSSSQGPTYADSAMLHNFLSGLPYALTKDYALRVRPVRAF